MIILEAIETYAQTYTVEESALIRELEQATFNKTNAPQMLSGKLVGRFLKFLVQITGAQRVLEIGMFTGYSALWMAEGLSENGEIITCDIDEKNSQIAQSFFDRSPHGKKIKIKLGPALETIKNLSGLFDLVFIDADKANYGHYYEESLNLLKSGGLIVVDNCLWGGEVLKSKILQDKQTLSIHTLNEKVTKDSRVENVLLTVRDGLNLIRKK